MMQGQFEEYDRTAQARVEAMSEAWGRLLVSRDERAAAELHKELHMLKGESRHLGMDRVTLLCDRLEDLALLAHRRRYDVPEELFLTMSMGIEFLGFLVTNPAGGADLTGFVAQLDEVVRDARMLPDPSAPHGVSEAMESVTRIPPSGAFTFVEGPIDQLSRASRQRFARLATAVYLEAVRAAGPSALRLRETWIGLKRELTDLGRVALRAQLLPLLEEVEPRAAAREKSVHVSTEVDDVLVSPELARALRNATMHLLDHALASGIELPAERVRAGKVPEGHIRVKARVTDGHVILAVEDDGAGIDVATVTRTAVAKGLVPEGTQLDAQSAHALLLDRPFTESGGQGGDTSLASVRDAVAREGGTLRLRSVAGQGTALTISVPDTATVDVRTFRSPASDLLLAVEASWSVSDGGTTGTPLDPVSALGVRGRIDIAPCRSVVFGRGNQAFEVAVRSAPTLSVASRIFPPDVESATEVVLVGDTEAILVRLDQLATASSRSTVVPPATDVLERKSGDRTSQRDAQRVLLMDDDASWLVVTRSALLLEGFDVRATSTVSDFADAIVHWGPDVVLTSTDMSAVSAEELYQRVKTARPLVPVLRVSSASPSRGRASTAQADGTISKSLDPNDLANAIRSRCGATTAA